MKVYMLLQTAPAFNPTTMCIEDWKSKNVCCQRRAMFQYLGTTLHNMTYMAYSMNPALPRVRREAVSLVKQKGWSTRKVARHFGYTHSAVVKWCKKDPTGGLPRIETLSSKT